MKYQALLLIFVLGTCFADFGDLEINLSHTTKCKADMDTANEQIDFTVECLENVQTEMNMDFQLDITKLGEKEKDAVTLCHGHKNKVLSYDEPPVFNATQLKVNYEKLNNKDTDPKVVQELYDAIDDCTKKHDVVKDGLACLRCSVRASLTICTGVDASLFY